MTFPYSLRIEMLQAVPRYGFMIYMNPISMLHKQKVIKLADMGYAMQVLLDGTKTYIPYYQLSCDEIEKAIKVYKALNK